MPPSTDPSSSSPSTDEAPISPAAGHTPDVGAIVPRPEQSPVASQRLASLRKRLLPVLSDRRNKVFFDSPGLLEQSHHWGGLVIWTIAAGTTAALIWAFVGKVDQTVVASGTLEPSSGKLSVKTPSGGIVRQIWIKDGQFVQRGTPLLVVESEATTAKLLNTRKQLALLRYENQLFNLLLDQSGGFNLAFLPPPPALIAIEDRTRSVQLTVQETAARLRQLRARLDSQSRTLVLKRDLVNSIKKLYSNGGFAKYNYLSAVDELQQLESQRIQTREDITTVLSQAGRQISTNDRQILGLEAEITGLQEQQRNLTLKALESGRIFNLSVGQGTVVAGGAEVMRIIPENGLRAKVYLSNQDLGFVRQGLPVKLAVSSFPPSEYGYLKASVLAIGADALSGEEASPVAQQKANKFPMTLQLGRNTGKEGILAKLAPGMQVSANIIVRQRPVITLLTDVFTKGSEDLKTSR